MRARALMLGLAAAMATAGCAPRTLMPERPAPRIVQIGASHPVAVPDTLPAVPTERESGVLEVITGVASYYSHALAGRPTASGESYDPASLVAAHRNLPFGTLLRVTNTANGRSVEVRVVDRGPFTAGRVLDVSRSAAEALDMIPQGVTAVRIEVLSYGG